MVRPLALCPHRSDGLSVVTVHPRTVDVTPPGRRRSFVPPALQAAAAPTAEEWAGAFEAERQGALRGLAGPITPAAVVEELRRCALAVIEAPASSHFAAGWPVPVSAQGGCRASLARRSAQIPHACRARAAEAQLTQQLAALQSRAAALQLSDSASRGENLQLRQALHSARAAAEPSVVQLRQLLLDPGVNREFSALRAELEARSRELAAAQLQLAALQVRPDPLLVKLDRQQVGGVVYVVMEEGGRGAGAAAGMRAIGCTAASACVARMSTNTNVNKPTTLPQEEIAELRRQVGESRAQQLERALAAAREQLAELRASHRGELGAALSWIIRFSFPVLDPSFLLACFFCMLSSPCCPPCSQEMPRTAGCCLQAVST